MLCSTLKSIVSQKSLNSVVSENDYPGYIALEICACIFEWESIYQRRVINVTVLIC